MTAPVRITLRLQVGDRILQYIAEGDDFDGCVAAVRKMRDHPEPAPPKPVIEPHIDVAGSGLAP